MFRNNNLHRVRTVIPFLPGITILKKEKIIPNKVIFPTHKKGGKLYSAAQKMGYSQHGLFMEEVIEKALDKNVDIEKYLNYLKNNYKDYKIDYSHYEDIIKLVREHFKGVVDFQVELNSSPISGHPDLIYSDTVYDIKTTYSFNSMRTETIYQLLAYYCLCKKLNKNITKIGLVLPVQLAIHTFDLTNWKWEPFWERLVSCIDNKHKQRDLYMVTADQQFEFQSLLKVAVGHTVYKSKLFDSFSWNKPLQFFIRGRATANVDVEKSFQTKLKGFTNKLHAPPVYIHAAYAFNLSNPWGNTKREDDSEDEAWTWSNVKALLNTSEYMGIRGVVIHVGKKGKPKLTEKEAIENMYESINKIAEGATQTCPLLIETPAAQNGEILNSPEELASFYLGLDENIRKNVGICVDTCHIYSAGYDPMEYLTTLDEFDIPVRLIHYNDSKLEKGCKRDRHAMIGTGYVGYEQLRGVLEWAVKRGVDMVTE